MTRPKWILTALLISAVALTAGMTQAEEMKLLTGKVTHPVDDQEHNYVKHRCLTPSIDNIIKLPLERAKPWSLPDKPLSAAFDTTINVLVLRFNFQYEEVDDPNTTGRGIIDVTTSYEGFLDSTGHDIDPTPHNADYFSAHMKAHSRYWEQVSEGKVTLTWDIFPADPDSAFTLPREMSYYGRCDFDSVVAGLEYFFEDGIRLADSAAPEIHFADYQAIFLFHAGSDRQNDIGFPESCNDLFTGFISFREDIPVDSGTYTVNSGLMMPESASQDGRVTALNGVIAHEFGHQLGLIDLYDTQYFLSRLGDFALMDNNGNGTGIDFENVGAASVFGAIPVYPCAWSRAYLGFVDVVDYRQGSDIRLVAAEVESNGIKVARVPISDKEYYLIENRCVDTDGEQTYTWADKATSVIQGPGHYAEQFSEDVLTGEYDHLLPGSGVLIYHIDESVLGLNYDEGPFDSLNNFFDNDVQWDWERPFISLVEADGLTNFGGYYYKGYGRADDMFRDDRATAFTPNTNPPTFDNTGNNSHIYITNISREIDSSGGKHVLLDTAITFDVETADLVDGFPKRAGYPLYGLNPVVDDIDRDGRLEIISASDTMLSVITPDGESFIQNTDSVDCTSCPTYFDIAVASVHAGQSHPLALYAKAPGPITAGPVVGDFGDPTRAKLVAVGYPNPGATSGRVILYQLRDNDANGLADNPVFGSLFPLGIAGTPIALSFGESFWALDNEGNLYRIDSLEAGAIRREYTIDEDEMHGIARIGRTLTVLAGDDVSSRLYHVDDVATSFDLDGKYTLGPVAADMNRDGIIDVVVMSNEGNGLIISVDTTFSTTEFSVVAELNSGELFSSNPIVADIDDDGYPDIVVGGRTKFYAYNREFTQMTDYPKSLSTKINKRVDELEFNDRLRMQDDVVIWGGIVADIDRGGRNEVILPTDLGNIYAVGSQPTFGFPISGGEKSAGSPVFFNDGDEGRLGYLGADGWFYMWRVDSDTSRNYWPMGGADAGGSFALDNSALPEPATFSELFPEKKFYNYPNPVTSGETTIRYFLGENASNVSFKIYDLSGEEVATLSGPTAGGVDNELIWNCGSITPGIYRCVAEVDFGSSTETAHTDIAVIR